MRFGEEPDYDVVYNSKKKDPQPAGTTFVGTEKGSVYVVGDENESKVGLADAAGLNATCTKMSSQNWSYSYHSKSIKMDFWVTPDYEKETDYKNSLSKMEAGPYDAIIIAGVENMEEYVKAAKNAKIKYYVQHSDGDVDFDTAKAHAAKHGLRLVYMDCKDDKQLKSFKAKVRIDLTELKFTK